MITPNDLIDIEMRAMRHPEDVFFVALVREVKDLASCVAQVTSIVDDISMDVDDRLAAIQAAVEEIR